MLILQQQTNAKYLMSIGCSCAISFACVCAYMSVQGSGNTHKTQTNTHTHSHIRRTVKSRSISFVKAGINQADTRVCVCVCALARLGCIQRTQRRTCVYAGFAYAVGWRVRCVSRETYIHLWRCELHRMPCPASHFDQDWGLLVLRIRAVAPESATAHSPL